MSIRDLIDAVEAGTAKGEHFHVAGDPARNWTGAHEILAYRAYNGSVDAAFALMRAVLPGWAWTLDYEPGYATAQIFEPFDDEWGDPEEAKNPIPARALLLAILKAVEAQEERG